MTTMKTDHKNFEALLKAKGISKKAFSYYTVAGWEKSAHVPAYAMVLLRHMPSTKAFVTAGELLSASLPNAILWNNDPKKQVPADIFIVATLERYSVLRMVWKIVFNSFTLILLTIGVSVLPMYLKGSTEK